MCIFARILLTRNIQDYEKGIIRIRCVTKIYIPTLNIVHMSYGTIQKWYHGKTETTTEGNDVIICVFSNSFEFFTLFADYIK